MHDPFNKGDLYFPVGVFIEGLLHGLYTALFMAALWVWKKRELQTGGSNFSTKFYLVVIILMWVVASAHLGTCIWQLLCVYILELKADGPSTSTRLLDATRWDMIANMILMAVMIWLGDVLVIYRTYIVWNRSYWVIVLPVTLHMGYLVANSAAIYYFSHPSVISRKQTLSWHKPIFPLLCVQNLITTGLLCYKVYTQHSESTKSGVVYTGGTRSLPYVARMLIETAMLYTIELFIVAALTIIRHPAKSMVILLLVPTVGIIFVLLSVRVHISGIVSTGRPITVGSFPNWLANSAPSNNEEIALPTFDTSSTGGIIPGTQTPNDKSALLHLECNGGASTPPNNESRNG